MNMKALLLLAAIVPLCHANHFTGGTDVQNTPYKVPEDLRGKWFAVDGDIKPNPKFFQFENRSCIPEDPPVGKVISGPGNCYDPAIGGHNSEWKTCTQVWVLENGNPDTEMIHNYTDWRCMCHAISPLYGEYCQWSQPEFLVWITAAFGFDVCIHLYNFLNGSYLVYFMLKTKKWKFNSASASAACFVVAALNETYRNVVFVLHFFPTTSPLAISQKSFDTLLSFGLAITMVFTAQGLLGLALAWIEIAESAATFGKKSRGLIFLRYFVNFCIFMITVIVVLMILTGYVLKISVLGVVLLVILVPLMKLGGNKLRKLLGAPKEGATTYNMAKGIRKVNNHLLTALVTFVCATIVFINQNVKSYDTGHGGGYSGIITVGFMGWAVWLIEYTMLKFFMDSNRAGINKFRGVTASTRQGINAATILSAASSAKSAISSRSSVAPE